jgi:hypothetical protein
MATFLGERFAKKVEAKERFVELICRLIDLKIPNLIVTEREKKKMSS